MQPLSFASRETSFSCGDFCAVYVLDPVTHAVGLRLIPEVKRTAVVPHREILDTPEALAQPMKWQPLRAYFGEVSLVQLKLAEDASGGGFTGGRSMRLNATVEGLRFVEQEVVVGVGGELSVRTTLRGARDFRCAHVLRYESGDEAVAVHTEFENTGTAPLTLEMLSTFCLGYLSPFDSEDSPERLRLHRFRSLWSSEGRHEAVPIEELHLERSWSGHAVVSERFGQVGSMPVRGFFPFAAVEDTVEQVFWGAQLACASSWQFEVYRRDDKLSVSGGLADREFGHWMKTVAPGERFITPTAFLSTGVGDIDLFSQRLTRMQAKALAGTPPLEHDLPLLFNEWCSSWGWPTPEFIAQTADKLRETPVRIFVIDEGWTEKPPAALLVNGDWNVDRARFPGGLKPVADALRARGLVPGLWFEFEVCTEGTEAFQIQNHKLRRDGRILRVGTRHFWDFTDPWTFEHLSRKVIQRLRDDGFGYLKVDYNDTIGVGCDHPDSLGEGLRQHVLGVQRFFRRLREELPELIIEVCASGGHRLEPSMLALGSMGSFSDAHESPEIPVIAANLHRLILPRQSQIWAVLHPEDSLQRLHYSLAAGFLGRLCLSGEIRSLSDEQWQLVKADLALYERVKAVIRDGESRLHRAMNASYRHPRGWQVVVRTASRQPAQALIVAHGFEASAGQTITVPLPPSATGWTVDEMRGHGLVATVNAGELRFECQSDWSACVARLRVG